MPDQMPDSQSKEALFQHTELFRKLNKREQRLLARLQEAEAARVKAVERLNRAETRLQKRTVRVQRAKTRLEYARQQLKELIIQAGEVGSIADVPALPLPGRDLSRPYTPDQYERDLYGRDLSRPETDLAVLSSTEAADFAREARAVAEAAENAARKAAERAVEVIERIEQMSTGRHLLQEVSQAQFEAEQASTVAQEAERAAQEAEQLAVEAEQLALEVQQVHEYTSEYIAPITAPIEEEQHAEISIDEAAAGEDRSEEGLFPYPRMIVHDDAEEEDEEDLQVAEVAAMMIADVAAAAAAESKAVAEASSARTREARHNAMQMEQTLQEIRAAIESETLTGADAATRLQDAEHNSTRAHALLADAEAAEEQAIQAARNAETEAEIAESLVFSDLAYHNSLRKGSLEEVRETPPEDNPSSAQSAEAVTSEQASTAETTDDESDITVKIPIMPSQENDVDE